MIVIAVFLLGAVCATPTDQESVRISFSQKALDFGEDVAFYMIDIIQKVAVGKLTLPNINTDMFRANNLKFAALNLGKPEILPSVLPQPCPNLAWLITKLPEVSAI